MTFCVDKLINDAANCGEPITVFLTNGVKLQGHIIGRDLKNKAFGLKRDNVTQAVFEHGVSTIMPSEENFNS